MADIQPQSPQQGVQQVKIISSGGAGSGTRPLQMIPNVVDGGTGTRPTPIVVNPSPAGIQIQSSSTPVMIQSSAGGQIPTVGGSAPAAGGSGGVMILQSAASPSSPPPPQPAAGGGGIVIRSATGASAPPQPSYNGPAIGQAPPSVVQPQPVAITPSPAPQFGGGVSPASGVVRVGPTAPTPQVYSQPQPAAMSLNQPTAARPTTAVDQTRSPATAPATTGKPRLTPGELLSKADLMWVCGFILAVVAVAFATMVFEDEVSTTWLLLFVAAASIGAFVKLQL